MTETWGICPLLGSDYEVSSIGNVRRATPGQGVKNRGKNLFQGSLRTGHRRIVVRERGYMVHVLVLETFVGPRPRGMVGCHNNGIPTDNRVENLRWDTRSGNQLDMNRHGTSGRSKTHCVNGHEFSDENTSWRLSPNGQPRRDCIACNRIRARRQRAAHGVTTQDNSISCM